GAFPMCRARALVARCFRNQNYHVSGAGRDAQFAPLTRRHVRAAGRLLSAAFDDDPVIGHFLPKSAKRDAVLPGFFRSTIEAALPLGHVYGVTSDGRLLAAAVWFPPVEHGGAAPQIPWRARTALLPTRVAYGKRLSS